VPHQVADRRVPAIHQQAVDRRRVAHVERHAPHGGRAVADRCLQSRDQCIGPGGVPGPRDGQEGREQRGADHGQALAGDQFARDHGHVGVEGVEQGAVGAQVLAHDGEQAGVQLAGGDDDREIVHVVVGAGDDARRRVDPGGRERLGLGAGAAHRRQLRVLRRGGVDDRHLEAVRMESAHHLAAETAVAAHHP